MLTKTSTSQASGARGAHTCTCTHLRLNCLRLGRGQRPRMQCGHRVAQGPCGGKGAGAGEGPGRCGGLARTSCGGRCRCPRPSAVAWPERHSHVGCSHHGRQQGQCLGWELVCRVRVVCCCSRGSIGGGGAAALCPCVEGRPCRPCGAQVAIPRHLHAREVRGM